MMFVGGAMASVTVLLERAPGTKALGPARRRHMRAEDEAESND